MLHKISLIKLDSVLPTLLLKSIPSKTEGLNSTHFPTNQVQKSTCKNVHHHKCLDDRLSVNVWHCGIVAVHVILILINKKKSL